MMANNPILIIGGGISGITAAVELAEVGKEVILVEKQPYLGGKVIRMNNYFPKLCPPACGLEINFRRIRRNPRIKIYESTVVKEISGSKGSFQVSLKQLPKYVKDTCTSCGKCSEVCPVEINDDFNFGFTKTKAIHLPHEMAFPNKYFIERDSCVTNCSKCYDVCEYEAIDLNAESSEFILEASLIIYATGWEPFPPENIANLNYLGSVDILTNIEFERMLALAGSNKIKRLSDQKEIKKIAFVQCAGSRDENYLPYCSAVCCSATLKHAINIRETNKECEVEIYYIDLRVSGRNEDFLNRAREDEKVEMIKGKVANVSIDKTINALYVEAENIQSAKKIKSEVDMVVLATGIQPVNNDNIGLKKSTTGFYTREQKEGIFITGCAYKPMDVSTSVKNATGRAMKAI